MEKVVGWGKEYEWVKRSRGVGWSRNRQSAYLYADAVMFIDPKITKHVLHSEAKKKRNDVASQHTSCKIYESVRKHSHPATQQFVAIRTL